METFDQTEQQDVEGSDCAVEVPNGKKGKATGKNSGEPQKKPDGSGKKRKRGPPRPHRQVPNDVLQQRLGKLYKRIEKAKTQLADATRHYEGYKNEKMYRESEETETD